MSAAPSKQRPARRAAVQAENPQLGTIGAAAELLPPSPGASAAAAALGTAACSWALGPQALATGRLCSRALDLSPDSGVLLLPAGHGFLLKHTCFKTHRGNTARSSPKCLAPSGTPRIGDKRGPAHFKKKTQITNDKFQEKSSGDGRTWAFPRGNPKLVPPRHPGPDSFSPTLCFIAFAAATETRHKNCEGTELLPFRPQKEKMKS